MISRGIDIFYWNGVPRLSQKLIGEWHSKCRTFFYRYLASLSLLEECKNWFTDETICNPTCHPGTFPIICKAYIHEEHMKTHQSTWKKHIKQPCLSIMLTEYTLLFLFLFHLFSIWYLMSYLTFFYSFFSKLTPHIAPVVSFFKKVCFCHCNCTFQNSCHVLFQHSNVMMFDVNSCSPCPSNLPGTVHNAQEADGAYLLNHGFINLIPLPQISSP